MRWFKEQPVRTAEERHEEEREHYLRELKRETRIRIQLHQMDAETALKRVQEQIQRWDETHANLRQFDTQICLVNTDPAPGEDEVPPMKVLVETSVQITVFRLGKDSVTLMDEHGAQYVLKVGDQMPVMVRMSWGRT